MAEISKDQNQDPEILIADISKDQNQDPKIFIADISKAPNQDPDIFIADISKAPNQDPEILIADISKAPNQDPESPRRSPTAARRRCRPREAARARGEIPYCRNEFLTIEGNPLL